LLVNVCSRPIQNDMTTSTRLLKNLFLLLGFAVLVLASIVSAQDKTNSAAALQSGRATYAFWK